jgi:hypothetical protein
MPSHESEDIVTEFSVFGAVIVTGLGSIELVESRGRYVTIG